MKMKTLVFLTLLLSTHLTQAQETPLRFIEVIGSHEMKIQPNEIYLEIQLSENSSNKNFVGIDTKEKQVLDVLNKLNIGVENLTVLRTTGSNYTVKRRDKHFRLDKEYSLKLSSMEEVNNFINSVQTLDLDNLRIYRISHSDLEKYKLEVKQLAIKNGKMKAEKLLGELSKQVGEIIEIKELSFYTTNPNSYYRSTSYADEAWNWGAAPGTTEVPIQNVKLKFDMYLKFEIK